MRSKLGEIMRSERTRREWSQDALARMCRVDRTSISNYERGQTEIPPNVLCRAIRAMKSEALRAQACFECPINLMTMPYLDRVDMHPMTVSQVVAEELDEAAVALRGLRLANKRGFEDLTDIDRRAMEHAAEQLVDLFAALHTILGCWQDWYEFDIDAQAIRGYEKLFEKGYASVQALPFEVQVTAKAA
ncbi:MAG: helix-turn-helix transcriptional regulator [Clostridiales bacterium]|nr:helix-turn-helix transcriptional regulator [Clostridiales bacterium]